ncbi:MAG TPA: PP2C family protein-serine/threonine phosphatase [Vicinamibacterales bacterium]|nr:PP2C family protein-serine/threonine phosphatase [Vicinamibacterales bacterium]
MPIALSPLDLLLAFVAFLMMLMGGAALVLAALRRRLTERALVFFAIFSLLYGLRVAASLPFLQSLFGIPLVVLREWRSSVTYVLPLPLILFVEQFVGRGWRGSMRAVLWMQAAYSTGALLADLVSRQPGVALFIKPYIIVTVGTVALVNVVREARRSVETPRVLVAGFATFLVIVGGTNFAQILHRPISPSLEVLGFMVLVVCLAAVVATRAIDTATRLQAIERELETARHIQTAILPQAPPAVPGVTICARYRPVAAVDGDFYDFVRLNDHEVGVAIADVSGHGVPAALIAAMFKVALTAQASHAGDPGAVLRGVNTVLCGLLTRDYVTAGYLVVDPAGGQVRYGGAGHPPPMIRSAGGRVDELTGGGTILGQFADARYDSIVRAVASPTRVLLYTDGVIEAASPAGEFFGVDRLQAFLATNGGGTTERFADDLLDALTRWRGSASFEDDVTFVIVDVTPDRERRPA